MLNQLTSVVQQYLFQIIKEQKDKKKGHRIVSLRIFTLFLAYTRT